MINIVRLICVHVNIEAKKSKDLTWLDATLKKEFKG